MSKHNSATARQVNFTMSFCCRSPGGAPVDGEQGASRVEVAGRARSSLPDNGQRPADTGRLVARQLQPPTGALEPQPRRQCRLLPLHARRGESPPAVSTECTCTQRVLVAMVLLRLPFSGLINVPIDVCAHAR